MIFLDVVDPTFSWVAPIIVLVAVVVCAMLTVVLPLLTSVLVKYISAKHQFMVSDEDRLKFVEACRTAVSIVEQNTRKALKLGEDAPDGAKKLEQGLEKLEELLRDMGIYERFKDAMEDGLEEAVSEMNGPLTAKEKDEIRASAPLKGD